MKLLFSPNIPETDMQGYKFSVFQPINPGFSDLKLNVRICPFEEDIIYEKPR